MELYSCPSPPILKYILCLVTFSKEQCIERKRKWNLDCRNLANTTLVKWSRTTSPIISHIDSTIWWDEKERHFISVVFLSISCPSKRGVGHTRCVEQILLNTSSVGPLEPNVSWICMLSQVHFYRFFRPFWKLISLLDDLARMKLISIIQQHLKPFTLLFTIIFNLIIKFMCAWKSTKK